jgi:aminoglycoside phosphotransferase
MDHGYTKETELIDGVVWKRFRGATAEARAQRESAALRWATHHLPVPELLAERPAELGLRFVTGRHGQDALDRAPRSVLRRCGELARRLSSLDPPDFLRDRATGAVVVHGDFGPQNILLDHGLRKVVALLDWERVHLGDPVEDLAWAEWIVRCHHPEAVRHLDALFAGYGDTPPWHERKRAMLTTCREHLDAATVHNDPEASGSWRDRLRWTQALLG